MIALAQGSFPIGREDIIKLSMKKKKKLKGEEGKDIARENMGFSLGIFWENLGLSQEGKDIVSRER